jgi:transmembrane sensor
MENNHHNDELQPNEDDTLLARWLAGDLSPEDLEALRNLEGYTEYVEMLAALEGLEMDEYSPTLAWQKLQPELEKEKAFGSLAVDINELEPDKTVLKNEPLAAEPIAQQPEAKIIEIPQPSSVPTIVNRPTGINKSQIVNPKWLAIAAAILIGVFGIWWFAGRDNFSFTDTDYVTEAGETKQVELPDGSIVTMNAMTKLGFSSTGWSDGREVALEGEAYFKAKKGKTFSVKTEQGTVEVVGTIFNVYARNEELEVKCTEGRVQVINPEGTERVLLKKGEQIAVLRGKMQQRQGLSFYPNWFKGESAFRSAPLAKVFGEIERQYGVMVLTDSLGERSFSGKFVNNDLKKALKMVCDPMKLKYEVRGDTVLVH